MTRGPLTWFVLLISTSALALSGDLLTVAVLALALSLAGGIAGGPRRPAHTAGVALGCGALAWWLLMTLVLTGPQEGTVLLTRPAATFGPGVAFGGPLTTSGVEAGLVGALRAYSCAVLVGLGWQVVSGVDWHRLARGALGAAAALFAPWCHLGDALSRRALQARQERAAGWRSPRGAHGREVVRWAASAASAPVSQRERAPWLRLVTVAVLVSLPTALSFGVGALLPGATNRGVGVAVVIAVGAVGAFVSRLPLGPSAEIGAALLVCATVVAGPTLAGLGDDTWLTVARMIAAAAIPLVLLLTSPPSVRRAAHA